MPVSTPALRSIRTRPSVRGSMPPRKLHYSDNFELVAMRHREFRRAPNPAVGRLESFAQIAERAAARFLFTNRGLCVLHGYELGDLKTYALVWTINFLGLYARDAADDENAKLLVTYLKQRFTELRALMFKKGRSCFPTDEVIEINLPAPM